MHFKELNFLFSTNTMLHIAKKEYWKIWNWIHKIGNCFLYFPPFIEKTQALLYYTPNGEWTMNMFHNIHSVKVTGKPISFSFIIRKQNFFFDFLFFKKTNFFFINCKGSWFFMNWAFINLKKLHILYILTSMVFEVQ